MIETARRTRIALLRRAFLIQLTIHGVACSGLPRAVYKRPFIQNRGQMAIGPEFLIRCPVTRSQLVTQRDATLKIGASVFINEGVIIAAAVAITIGDFVKIGDFVTIHDSNYHETDPAHPQRVAPVTIERNAWLGRNVIVLPGVTIGANSVIAAGSVVSHDVPVNVVFGGTPGRVLRAIEAPDEYVRP